ncbi:aminotransferase class V-fold PLP-dependent enzyme [Salibacterium salarium]|uniref:Aminotransferase class V-fold PLP-dependent enzyme n=1 Tax=Salibacterium salarium TaxID=284579 RepID=A0A428N1C8_9BACI|nr:IscS subfamily cysteine desulfurase [Salibacterium salarium]RSL32127.1 aminotransferase class V-fold PLP-dependent enzyme [Salibacterium salarium]
MIYLDHCATTPMSTEALETYTKTAQTFYGNEQSLHDDGDSASQLVHHCRNKLAAIVNGQAEGIYFTSGGSDSNITVLLSLAYGNEDRGRHIITSPLEHPSVYQALEKLKQEGFTVDEVAVKANGEVCLDSLAQLLREDTILVSICHASSETGVIQPLESIGQMLENIVFHSDTVQTFAKIPIDVKACRLQAISMSAHKLNGPKNNGACYIEPGTRWKGLYPHVTHQNGWKPGTIDVPGTAAFTEAAWAFHENRNEIAATWKDMQQWMLAELPGDVFSLFGDADKRLPHHLALRAKDIEGQWMMLECNRHGIAISSGSACKSSDSSPPRSLVAMGHNAASAHGLFRISFGKDTTYRELEKTVEVLQRIESSSAGTGAS